MANFLPSKKKVWPVLNCNIIRTHGFTAVLIESSRKQFVCWKVVLGWLENDMKYSLIQPIKDDKIKWKIHCTNLEIVKGVLPNVIFRCLNFTKEGDLVNWTRDERNVLYRKRATSSLLLIVGLIAITLFWNKVQKGKTNISLKKYNGSHANNSLLVK